MSDAGMKAQFTRLFGKNEGVLWAGHSGDFKGKGFRYPEDVDSAVAYLTEKSNNKADTYFASQLLDLTATSREKIHCTWAQTLSLELDGFDPKHLLVTPSDIVETSPGHYHVWWVLDSRVPAEMAEQVKYNILQYHYKQIIEEGLPGKIDKGTHDITRYMRPVGTINYGRKKGLDGADRDPFVVSLKTTKGAKFRLSDFNCYPKAELITPTAEFNSKTLTLEEFDFNDYPLIKKILDDDKLKTKDGDRRHALGEHLAYVGCEEGLLDNQIAYALSIHEPTVAKITEEHGNSATEAGRYIAKTVAKARLKHNHEGERCIEAEPQCANTPTNQINEKVIKEAVDKSLNKKKENVEILPKPSDPMKVARYLEPEFVQNNTHDLVNWRGEWMEWKTTHWAIMDEREIKADLYKRTEHAKYMTVKADGTKELIDWAPTISKIKNLMEAIQSVVLMDPDVTPPTWVGQEVHDTYISCENCLVNIHTREQVPHNIDFFNLVTVPFKYDPNAAEPKEWLKFLNSLWAESPDSISLLQEWFGYVLSGRTDMQKMLYLLGPKRSGKGTIARVLTALIGRKNMEGPTIDSLAKDFGLATLVGKTLAVIADARFSGNTSTTVERLLAISGEDVVEVNRKYRPQESHRLPVRFMIMSNDLPRFKDASAAIVSRFLVLQTGISWFGKEDRGLEAKLNGELTGILNWALDGLDRLLANGRFTEPQEMLDAIEVMEESASPMIAFVRDRCEQGFDHVIPLEDLFNEYTYWAAANGNKALAKNHFTQELHSAFPEVKQFKPRINGAQVKAYRGLKLKADS